MSSAMALCVLLSNFSSFFATSRFRSLNPELQFLKKSLMKYLKIHQEFLMHHTAWKAILKTGLTSLVFLGQGWLNPEERKRKNSTWQIKMLQ